MDWEFIESGQTYQTRDDSAVIVWHVFSIDSFSISFCGYSNYFKNRKIELIYDYNREDFEESLYMGMSGTYVIKVEKVSRESLVSLIFKANSFRVKL